MTAQERSPLTDSLETILSSMDDLEAMMSQRELSEQEVILLSQIVGRVLALSDKLAEEELETLVRHLPASIEETDALIDDMTAGGSNLRTLASVSSIVPPLPSAGTSGYDSLNVDTKAMLNAIVALEIDGRFRYPTGDEARVLVEMERRHRTGE